MVRPADPDYDEIRARLGQGAPPEGQDLVLPSGGRAGLEYAPWGYGAWVPFLPRKLAMKLALFDVVEAIQGAVSTALDQPWPGDGFTVSGEYDGQTARLCFAGPGGDTVPAAALDPSGFER